MGDGELNGAAVKEPSELSEEEQEARQTGEPVKAPGAKKPKAKAPKKTKEPVKKAAKKGAKKSKKTVKAAPVKKAKVKKAAPASGVRRGPKGTPEDKRERNAPDKGVFGRKMARARKEQGLTQKALAAKLEVTQPALCNIEKGTVGASEKLAARISKALGL